MAADVSIIVETNAKEVGNEFTGMAGQIIGAADKAKKLAQAFDFLDSAMNGGKIDAQQYSKAVQVLDKTQDALYSSIGKTNAAVKSQSAAMDNAATSTARASNAMSQAAVRAQNLTKAQRLAGKSTNKFGMVSQQVGYQVGDFFVQVQSGTDALVAFGQQGTQLAGLLPGLGGAVLGIGLSLGTALLNASLRAKELRVDFKAVGKDLSDALEPISPLIDAIGSALSSAGQVASQVFQSMLDNFARVVSYAIAFALIMTTKVVVGFVASGKAASAFFALVKRGLMATGIGVLVVAVGELINLLTRAYKSTGSLGGAFGFLATAFSYAWDGIVKSVPLFGDAIEGVTKLVEGMWNGMLGNMANALATFLNDFAFQIRDVAGLGGVAQTAFNISDSLSQKAGARFRESDRLSGAGQSIMDRVGSGVAKNFEDFNNFMGTLDPDGPGIDTSDWLVPDTDDKKGGSKKTFDELIKALRKEVSAQKELLGVYGAKRESIEQIISFEKQLERTLTDNEKLKVDMAARELYRTEQNAKLLDMVVDNLESAFMSMVDGSMSVVDAFRNMLKQIILAIYQQEVARPAAENIGSWIKDGITALFSANGNVIGNGMHVKAYADGGVVNRATAFPMRGGVGVMGEAGPEAIMPLKRGKNGKLGVQMEGSGGSVVVNNNFNIAANGDESVKRIIRGEVPRITEATKSAVLDAKRRGGSYGRSF